MSNMAKLSDRIYYEIESKCNLHCIHCSNLLENSTEEQINIEEILRFHKIVVKKGIKNCVITGGEPTIHKDFFRIVNEVSKISKVLVTTNGTTLSINDLILMLTQNPNLSVQISLDGITKNTFENVRGRNSYNKVEKLLKEIITNKIAHRIGISMTIMNINIKEVDDMISFCIENGFSYIYFPILLPVGNAKRDWNFIAPKVEDQIKIENKIIERIIENKSKTEISSNRIDQIITKVNSNGESDCLNNLTLKVTPNGNIFPCPISDENEDSLGNIKDIEGVEDLEEVLRTFNGLNFQNDAKVLKMEECKTCLTYKYCRSRFCSNCKLSGENCNEVVKYNCAILRSHLKNAIEELGINNE